MVGTKAKTLDSNATGIVKNPREPCDITSHFEKMKVTKSIKNACMNVYDSEKVRSNQIAYTNNDKISEPWPEHLVPSSDHRVPSTREATQEQSRPAQKTLSETLMDMAGYRQISATACTIKVGSISICNNS